MANRSKTWWGEEFLHALEGFMDEGRLTRGRSYAAEHRRKRFKMKAGVIEATMVGNINPYFGVYKTPYYEVKIEFERIAASVWKKIVKRLGADADWVTHLLLGEVPPTIEEALADSRVKLLPRSGKDIHSSCSCPDWANPCKHVAGVYYYVASLLDRDPLLLFEIRGMERSKLMEGLAASEFGAALRGELDDDGPDLEAAFSEPRFARVEEAESEASASDLRAFWRGTPLPRDVLQERPPPLVSALLLRREGDYPEFWLRQNSFLDAMSGIYERVAKRFPAPFALRAPGTARK